MLTYLNGSSCFKEEISHSATGRIIIESFVLIRTPLLSSRSVFATMTRYHINHRALLTANEVNRFMCSVIRAHLRDLHIKKVLDQASPKFSANLAALSLAQKAIDVYF